MSERKRSRAVVKFPRANSLCARSKALSAAASSREGWRGGVGVCLATGRCGAEADFAAAFDALDFDVFAGADFTEDFAAAFEGFAAGLLFADFAGADGLAAAFFAGAGFAASRFEGFADERADFEAGADFVDLAGEAFRTGAFSAAARLGLGFAAFAVTLRPLAEDFCEALCGAGREELLLAPLILGSLMRSTRFSQIASP